MGRNDYTKAQRDAWQAERMAGEAARGLHSKGIDNLPRVSDFKKSIAAGLNAKNRQPIAQVGDNSIKKIHRSKTLVAVTDDSECFSDLRYSKSAGGVYATFRRTDTQYFYPMSRADALAWFADDLGEYFNAEIRPND
jgi:hypothetical protein